MKPTIYVVDDEVTLSETLASILRKNGYSALSFTSPFQVLNQAQVRVPDLLVSDVEMPGICGVDLGFLMRRLYPGCKVLLFSGLAFTSDLQHNGKVFEHGFRVLTKPVHPNELLLEIDGLLQTERLSA